MSDNYSKILAGLVNDAPEIKPTDKLNEDEVARTLSGLNKPRFTTEGWVKYRRDKEADAE